MPGRRIGRSRFTESEAGELDERELNRDITAAYGGKQRVIDASSGEHRRVGRVAAQGVELEVALEEGTNNAVFGSGAGIDRQRHTRTGSKVIAIAIADAEIAAPRRLIVDAAIECRIDAHISTQLDAGVGARNKEETGTIQGADPHVLDRFGLDGKISGLCSAHGD